MMVEKNNVTHSELYYLNDGRIMKFTNDSTVTIESGNDQQLFTENVHNDFNYLNQLTTPSDRQSRAGNEGGGRGEEEEGGEGGKATSEKI